MLTIPSSAPPPSRRNFLAGAAGAASLLILPVATRAQIAPRHTLTARPGTAALRGPGQSETAIWGFEGRAPGPVLRVRQGERLDVTFRNALPQPSTIHWHGIRLPNDMDGVPNLTQDPVMPGELYHYSFPCADAGTYWYHPHGNSSEQLGRGLWGPLIVEERKPPPVDRDLVWVIGDWKLDAAGQIDPDFKNAHERAHEGRRGNTITVNGAPGGTLALRRNERVRVRLINVANARIFELGFAGADPWLIALDGHPVAPRRLGEARLTLAPGMRADLLLDGVESAAADPHFYHVPPADDPVPLLRIALDPAAPLRPDALPAPAALAANPVAEPDLATAERQQIVFADGGPHASPGGAHPDAIWTVNGTSMIHGAIGHDHTSTPPLFSFRRGASVILALRNDTSFDHPVHLHGHTFRILSRDGKPVPNRPWSDTILMTQLEQAEIAFVADNPGDWMIHCHILEHQDSGMAAIIRVRG